ncbi:MAG: hypothetical protein U0835_06615 [Isosphaeraceae bacterium]
MHRRRRVRKKLHRRFLKTVCAFVVTFDDALRQRLLGSAPGEEFVLDATCSAGLGRLTRRWGLRYRAALARKHGTGTATVAYWAEEFPAVRDHAVIFDLADLG